MVKATKTNKYTHIVEGTNAIDACGPDKKRVKQTLKELLVVIEDINQMLDAGYIDYHVQDRLVGHLEIRRRGLVDQLASIKKTKKAK